MTEDATLATITLIFLIIVSIMGCLAVAYKMRREEDTV